MGFLHRLWDETLAGPAPETGLGKLRKYDSFSSATASSRPPMIIAAAEDIPVSRSIVILRTNSVPARCAGSDSGSVPSSPATPSNPTSPFSPSTPRGDFKRLARRKLTAEPLMEREDPRSPSVYDWIVINALDN